MLFDDVRCEAKDARERCVGVGVGVGECEKDVRERMLTNLFGVSGGEEFSRVSLGGEVGERAGASEHWCKRGKCVPSHHPACMKPRTRL